MPGVSARAQPKRAVPAERFGTRCVHLGVAPAVGCGVCRHAEIHAGWPGESTEQVGDHLGGCRVQVGEGPGRCGVQHPAAGDVGGVGASRARIVAPRQRQRAEGIGGPVLALQRRHRSRPRCHHRPARVAAGLPHGLGERRGRTQQDRGLFRRDGDHDGVEARRVQLTIEQTQPPTRSTADGLGAFDGRDGCVAAQRHARRQVSGDLLCQCVHRRHAEPAQGGVWIADGCVRRCVQDRPACIAPAQHLRAKCRRGRTESRRAVVERPSRAAPRGTAPAGPAALVEQRHGVPHRLQLGGGGQAGDARADDGDPRLAAPRLGPHELARRFSQRISAPTAGSFSYSSSAASQ